MKLWLIASLLCSLTLLASGAGGAPQAGDPAVPDAASAPEAPAAPVLAQVTVEGSGSDFKVLLRTEGRVTVLGKRLSQPDRYYVDLTPCVLGREVQAPTVEGMEIRVAQFSRDPATVRVVCVLPAGLPSASHAATGPFQHEIRISPKPRAAARAVPASQGTGAARRPLTSRGGVGLGARRGALLDLLTRGSEALGAASPLQGLPAALRDAAAAALSRGGRYVWGGQTPDGFDCSGLVGFLFRSVGINLPRTAADQFRTGQRVERQDLMPGDLVFFARRGRIYHVGVYVGGDLFFHAANPTRGLTVDSLSGSSYGKTFAGARRLLAASQANPNWTSSLPADPEASEIGE